MLALLRTVSARQSKYRHFPLLCLFTLIILVLYFNHQHYDERVQPKLLTFSVKENFQIQTCTSEESIRHGNLFKSFDSSWSSCYADIYLTAFDRQSRSVQNLIDVGANKAYAIAAWLIYFLPQLQIDPARLGQYLSTLSDITESCGSCNDCEDPPLNNIQNQSIKLQIHAFEPQPETIELLRGIRQWMNISENNPKITLEFHGMAVSDQTGQTLFKKCNKGNEVCSLDISTAGSTEQVSVNVTSLDDFSQLHHLEMIDVLKIDTEGFDPFVFRGARRLLTEHRIRLFIFEHLKIAGAWQNTSLEKETKNLFDIGYVCYMAGKTGFIRISSCWNDQFTTVHNNVLCVSSRDRNLLFNIDQLRLNGTVPIRKEVLSTEKSK